MGFYIRQGISFGPLRFNLSKSGIGVSVGVKGARIGTGPSGAYVHMGRHGLYYRQRLGGSEGQSTPPRVEPYQPSAQPATLPDVGVLVDSSSKQILSQINSRASRTPIAPFVLIATIALAFLAAVWTAVVAAIIAMLL